MQVRDTIVEDVYGKMDALVQHLCAEDYVWDAGRGTFQREQQVLWVLGYQAEPVGIQLIDEQGNQFLAQWESGRIQIHSQLRNEE
jgi:hypothetical protein